MARTTKTTKGKAKTTSKPTKNDKDSTTEKSNGKPSR